MKIAELRNKTENELNEALKKIKIELKQERIKFLQKKEKNIKKPGLLKKEVARILTVLNEKSFLSNTTKQEKVEEKGKKIK